MMKTSCSTPAHHDVRSRLGLVQTVLFSVFVFNLGTISIVSAGPTNLTDLCGAAAPPYGPYKYSGIYGDLPFQDPSPDVMFCNALAGDVDKFRYYQAHVSEHVSVKTAPRGDGPIKTIPKTKEFDRHMENIPALESECEYIDPDGNCLCINPRHPNPFDYTDPTRFMLCPKDFTEWNEYLETDALLVIHKGEIYYEKYSHNSASDLHLVHSITKSHMGLVAAMLEKEGKLDLEKPVTFYLPELDTNNTSAMKYYDETKEKTYPYKEMTVRMLMDMTTEFFYDETVHDKKNYISETANELFGYRNQPFLFGRSAKDTQGKKFRYKTLDSDILGMVLESPKVLNGNGKLWEEIHSRIWSKLGHEEHKAIQVDWQHHPMYSGGLQMSARDLAKVGMMLMNQGKNMDGEEIVPEDIIDDLLNPPELNIEQFKDTSLSTIFKAYRNQFWVPHKEEVIMMKGIYGQYNYMDFKNDILIIKLASNAYNQIAFYWDFKVFDMVTKYIIEHGDDGGEHEPEPSNTEFSSTPSSTPSSSSPSPSRTSLTVTALLFLSLYSWL